MSGFFGGGGTAYSDFTGSSTTVTGSSGLVPAPAAGKNTRYLSSNATFGELPLLPQYKNTATNNWISIYTPSQATGSGTLTTKVRGFYLLYVPSDGNIDTLGFRVATAPVVTAFNLHVALWEVNEDGTVGSYVIGGTGSSGLSNTTNISISISSTPVKRGFYWISGTSDISTSPATIQMGGNTSCGIYYSFMGSTAISQAGGAVFIPNYTTTTYNQTTHETFSYSNASGWGSQTPSLAFQYV
jgi:hypothetical protein